MRRMLQNSKTFHRGILGVAALAVVGSLAVFAAPAPNAPAPPAPAAPAPPAPSVPGAPALPGLPGGPSTPAADAAKARAAAVAAKANIDVGEGWTRATSGNTASVFMSITSVKDADRLLAIDVEMADKAEIQETPGKAMPAAALEIPAGGTIDFKPGGRSLVLTGLKAPLKEGESFLITLKFDKAGTQSLPVKVLSASATGLPPVGSTRKGDTTAAVSQR